MRAISYASVLAVLAAGCASPPQGYGVSAPKFNEEAMLRQQVANEEPTANARGMYLDMIRQMQSKGLFFASLAHIDAFELKHGVAPDVELLRAHALREAGQVEESAAIYRKLLNTEAGAPAAQGLGLLAGSRGDYARAVVSLRDAARRDPTNPLIVSDLGYALLRNGETAAARMPLAQAAELAPENPKILANLALLMLVSGDTARAAQVMDKAGLSPDAQAAVRRMAVEIAGRSTKPEPVGAARPAVRAVPEYRDAPPRPVVARVPETPVRSSGTAAARQSDASAREEAAPAPSPVRAVAEPVIPPVSAPMQSMLDRFTTATP